MARPQAADYAEKRAAITAAAARLFARHGYAGAPIAGWRPPAACRNPCSIIITARRTPSCSR